MSHLFLLECVEQGKNEISNQNNAEVQQHEEITETLGNEESSEPPLKKIRTEEGSKSKEETSQNPSDDIFEEGNDYCSLHIVTLLFLVKKFY